jgi:hypothetical protein
MSEAGKQPPMLLDPYGAWAKPVGIPVIITSPLV